MPGPSIQKDTYDKTIIELFKTILFDDPSAVQSHLFSGYCYRSNSTVGATRRELSPIHHVEDIRVLVSKCWGSFSDVAQLFTGCNVSVALESMLLFRSPNMLLRTTKAFAFATVGSPVNAPTQNVVSEAAVGIFKRCGGPVSWDGSSAENWSVRIIGVLLAK